MLNEKVLIVDDNQTNLDLLGRICTSNNYTVTLANSGHVALEKIRDNQFDAVLLDIMMPGINGFSVLNKIRKYYSMSDLPVIMVTAIDEAEDITLAFECGANDYITKPLNRNILISRLSAQLSIKHAHEKINKKLCDMSADNHTLRHVFERYMTREVVDKLMNASQDKVASNELRNLTIMFTDIRDFTLLSERLSPNDLMQLLNNYLAHMITAVQQYGGCINQFTGDGLMVIFGTSNEHRDSSERALACSLEMQRRMKDVNKYNLQHGFPVIGMGIGIDAGEVMLGNIGSESRACYSVIGKHVNLAARIVAMAKEDQVLVSENLMHAINQPVCVIKSKATRPKGIEKDVNIYQLEAIRQDCEGKWMH